MTRDEFVSVLKAELRGLPADELEDIVTDYCAHFDEGRAEGRSDNDLAAALGDPVRLARELRAEIGFRRWQNKRTPGNFMRAMLAICGLAAIDLFMLLPLVSLATVAAIAMGFALIIIGIIGTTLLACLIFGDSRGFGSPWVTGLAGIGLVAGGIGWSALLLLGLDRMVTLLSRYARLHYRLLRATD